MSHHEPPVVLIAEDSDAIRSIVAFLLKGRGYSVIECADGHQALDQARENHPDAVILDVMMPGPSGFEVCRALKADPATRQIPIMILTSVTQGAGKNDEHWKSLSGADDFVTKPFKAADILTRIAAMTGPKPAADGSLEKLGPSRAP